MTAFAEIRNYRQLIEALRQRSAAIGVTREQLDAEVQPGYAAKFWPPSQYAPSGFRTLGPVLMTLGVKLVLMEDVKSLKIDVAKSAINAVRGMPSAKKRKRHRFPRGAEHSKLMHARWLAQSSPVKRRKIARAAAKARWHRPKVVEINQASGR